VGVGTKGEARTAESGRALVPSLFFFTRRFFTPPNLHDSFLIQIKTSAIWFVSIDQFKRRIEHDLDTSSAYQSIKSPNLRTGWTTQKPIEDKTYKCLVSVFFQ